MIERASESSVRVLTLAHGKANALDVETAPDQDRVDDLDAVVRQAADDDAVGFDLLSHGPVAR